MGRAEERKRGWRLVGKGWKVIMRGRDEGKEEEKEQGIWRVYGE